MNLKTIDPGMHFGLEVRPRWPSKHVRIDPEAFARLQAVQSNLPPGVTLILTRGFEEASSRLGRGRKVFRRSGINLFQLLYPSRTNEIVEIFGSNGHDTDGTHVDVSFRLKGRRIRLLPLGVFTPPHWHRRRNETAMAALETVKSALEYGGFKIHSNTTESMQIHCDMI